MRIDIEQLVLEILRTHYMTTTGTWKNSVRVSSRICAGCTHELPWKDWEAPLQEHLAKVVAERLGS